MGKYQVPVSLLKYHIKSEMLYATSHIHERIQKHSSLPPLLPSLKLLVRQMWPLVLVISAHGRVSEARGSP